MAEILKVNVNRFPLNGTRFHTQGKEAYLAVGLEEVGRLPKAQRLATENLRTRKPVTGFLDLRSGDLLFTEGGSPIVAKISQKGEVKKFTNA